MKQTLAVDMDEVLADPVTKMCDWYARDYGVSITAADLQGHALSALVPPERSHIFHDYLNTPGFFRDLPLLPDAVTVMERLNEKYELFIVSAAMEFPNSLKDKYDWLGEYFPFLHWQQICLCGSKVIIQTDIIIDDRSRNFVRHRGRKLLFTAHHNVLEKECERVNNWQEVASLLL
ncbi:5' nucleotidase, NT5C type [Compostibacter hankyongensis]|uniref:5'-3'-deoxyribonucleotidase n=1 Tax=Compostibacter hankyongensis TaxID=1007089 RepID=A0ABP8G754_9BACT